MLENEERGSWHDSQDWYCLLAAAVIAFLTFLYMRWRNFRVAVVQYIGAWGHNTPAAVSLPIVIWNWGLLVSCDEVNAGEGDTDGAEAAEAANSGERDTNGKQAEEEAEERPENGGSEDHEQNEVQNPRDKQLSDQSDLAADETEDRENATLEDLETENRYSILSRMAE